MPPEVEKPMEKKFLSQPHRFFHHIFFSYPTQPYGNIELSKEEEG